MKAKDLVAILQDMPNDTPVVIFSYDKDLDGVESHKIKDVQAPHTWEFDGGKQVVGIEICRDETISSDAFHDETVAPNGDRGRRDQTSGV